MTDATAGQSSFLTQLSGFAWALALVAAVALGRLISYASADDAAIGPSHLVWLAVCVLSGCLSVGCFVLVAVKRTELHLARLVTHGPAVDAPTTGR